VHRESFRLLPFYLHYLRETDPGGHHYLEKASGGVFRGVFSVPGVSKGSYEYCRKLIILDGTFLKGKWPLVSVYPPETYLEYLPNN
jgi:hypothetical protein